MKMFFLILFIGFILFFVTLIVIAFNNFGKISDIDRDLLYYKNGYFLNPEPAEHTFKRKIPEQEFNFFKLLFKSENAPKDKIPTLRPVFSKNPEDFAFYWLGHSNMILELDNKRLIIDPVFDNSAPIPFAVSRYVKSPIKRKELPNIDYVIITHDHYDHLERKTVQFLRKSKFIVPLGLKSILVSWGVNSKNIEELSWDEVFKENTLSFRLLPTVHFSGRTFKNRNKTLWGSYIIESKNKKIFWGGDGGYGKHFLEYGKKYGPFDFIALEIDAWNENWADIHMFPDEIIKTAKDLKTSYVLPIHWAVFDLAMHPWKESINYVLKEAEKSNIKLITPKIGEKVVNVESFINNFWWKNIE